MTPHERAIRLADLEARQRRAQAAADGLYWEWLVADTVDFLLDRDAGEMFRQIVAKVGDKADPAYQAVAAAIPVRQREEAAIERRIAKKTAAEL